MESYNYEALHRHTITMGIKRTWDADSSGDPSYVNLLGYRPEAYTNTNVSVPIDRSSFHTSLNGLDNGVVTDSYAPNFGNLVEGYVPKFVGVVPHDGYGDGVQINEPFRDPSREPTRVVRELSSGFGGASEGEKPVCDYGSRMQIRGSLRDVREFSPSPRPAMRTLVNQRSPPLAGMIFGCTTETYQECMRLQLFALPVGSRREVMRVVPGSKLFLYNYRERELSGIFEAVSHGDMDIVCDAFGGQFRAQVRVKCVETCSNLPLEAFKEAIRENFESNLKKFKYNLDEAQVHRLVALFRQETEYWQRRSEPAQHVRQETIGKDSEALTEQPRTSNHGELSMAGASAPPYEPPLLWRNTIPPRQAGPNVLMRPLPFSPLPPLLPTPKAPKSWSANRSTYHLDGKEATTGAWGHCTKRYNEEGISLPNCKRKYVPYGQGEEMKKSVNSVPEIGRSVQLQTNCNSPVSPLTGKGLGNAQTTTALPSELDKDEPTILEQEEPSSPCCQPNVKETSKPELLDVVSETHTDEDKRPKDGADQSENQGTQSPIKPKSRKKMKASKTRSNVIGKSSVKSPPEVVGTSSPVETIEEFLGLRSACVGLDVNEFCDVEKVLQKSNQGSRQEQVSSFSAHFREGYSPRDITPWKLLNNGK